MDLLEYQAKDLFRAIGIPVPPSQRIERPGDLKNLQIPYPVALKSQVYIGGRGRVGGVRFVSNTIDAIAAAQTIFNLPIMGEYPKVLLAEAKYEAEQELYLAVVLNHSIRRPVLLGSAQGGMEVQTAIAEIQHVVVDQDFSPFYARRLVIQMGLKGALINAVSGVLEKMYALFVQQDLDLLEINPLGVNALGQVMALDGKVVANDTALGRHPLLSELADSPATPETSDRPDDLYPIAADGTIGIICNGAGLTLATIDLICQGGGKPAYFLNLGSETYYDWQPERLCRQLEAGLSLFVRYPQVKAILVNIMTGSVPCDQIATAIGHFLQRPPLPAAATLEGGPVRRLRSTPPRLVVRLIGSRLEDAEKQLSLTQATMVEDLDRAIAQVIKLAKG